MRLTEPGINDVTRPLLPARVTVTEATANALRDLILSDDLSVGTQLRQDDLAKRLGVSRTPLREALNRLASEGLVRLDAHHGAVVASPSTKELLDIYEARKLLEIHTGRLAARRCVPSDVRELRTLLDRLPPTADVAAAARVNAEFHTRLYAIAQEPVLAELITVLRNRSEPLMRMLFGVPPWAKRAATEHGEMVTALANNDENRLLLLIDAHLDATVKAAVALIDDRGGNRSDERATTAQRR